MGIQVEFNPDLALRAYRFKGRLEDECLPRVIEEGKIHNFLKKGQRNYWLEGEVPLLETKGNGALSEPLASIQIIYSTHFLRDGDVWTKGMYEIIKILNKGEIYFNGFNVVR